jgi:hypothetical protein
MKFPSTTSILLLASFSGAAFAADGQPIDAAATRLRIGYTDSHVLSANSKQKSAGSESIYCACVVPMTFA